MPETFTGDLERLIERLYAELDAPGEKGEYDLNKNVRGSLEELLSLISSMACEEPGASGSSDPGRFKTRDRLAAAYGQYIWSRECAEADQLLEKDGYGSAGFVEMMSGEFGARIYRRVRDMFDHVNFSSCRHLVMVGCGPLPGTLFNILESSDVPQIIGLDIDQPTVASVQRLSERFGLDRLTVQHCEGAAYDYGAADLVYVANLVRGKADVLTRIADTVKPGTGVILREPFAGGGLFAERGLDDLDPRYTVTGEGEADTGFLSRHVFLMVADV